VTQPHHAKMKFAVMIQEHPGQGGIPSKVEIPMFAHGWSGFELQSIVDDILPVPNHPRGPSLSEV
jgi:hypothetical protein